MIQSPLNPLSTLDIWITANSIYWQRKQLKARMHWAQCSQRVWGNGNKARKRKEQMKKELGRGYLKTFNQ